jgi:hypothetical protein
MSTSPFDQIFTNDLKAIYNDAIDAILNDTGLTVKCRLLYSGQENQQYCNNCIYDQISKLSSNIYNSTGPNPFPENSICPVCMGMGIVDSDSSEILSLACIFDGKYFLNWSSKTANIPDGMIQTICRSIYLPKIRNANELIVDVDLEKYGGYNYQRDSDPNPVGFGDNRYIITMWRRK